MPNFNSIYEDFLSAIGLAQPKVRTQPVAAPLPGTAEHAALVDEATQAALAFKKTQVETQKMNAQRAVWVDQRKAVLLKALQLAEIYHVDNPKYEWVTLQDYSGCHVSYGYDKYMIDTRSCATVKEVLEYIAKLTKDTK